MFHLKSFNLFMKLDKEDLIDGQNRFFLSSCFFTQSQRGHGGG